MNGRMELPGGEVGTQVARLRKRRSLADIREYGTVWQLASWEICQPTIDFYKDFYGRFHLPAKRNFHLNIEAETSIRETRQENAA